MRVIIGEYKKINNEFNVKSIVRKLIAAIVENKTGPTITLDMIVSCFLRSTFHVMGGTVAQ